MAAPVSAAQSSAAQSPSQSGAPGPTPQELDELTQRVIKNQHQDDLLGAQYERTEHDHLLASGHGLHNRDTLTIMIPTGTGEAKIELERDGKASTAVIRDMQWRNAAKTLNSNTHPGDPDVKREYERAEKRNKERIEMVDDLAKAFHFTYLGRESINGQMTVKANFEPVADFHSGLRYSSTWKHIHGTVWVDESNAQIVRISGELFDDVSIAEGLVVKVYKGSSMTLDQTEVAPGLWLPLHAKIDLTGRLLLLPATYHDQVDDSMFQRVGAPAEALQTIFHGRLDDPPQ